MSTTIHPHPNPHSFFPNHFNILSLTHNIPSFVVQIHLRFLLLGFPFSSHVFNFPVSLLHFASKLYNPPQSLSSLSPSKLFLYNPTVIFPLFFHCWPTNLLHFFFFFSFPTSTLHSVAQIGSPPLDLVAPSLFPCPHWCLCRPSFSGCVWCVSL